MGFFLLLFSISFAAILLLLVASVIFRQTLLARHKYFLLGMFVTLCATYVLGLWLVWRDPYWYDASPYKEYIPLNERFGWAVMIGGVLELPLLALFLIGWLVVGELRERSGKGRKGQLSEVGPGPQN